LVVVAHARKMSLPQTADGYVRVPGGTYIHKSCIVDVPDGYYVDENSAGDTVLIGEETGTIILVAPCQYEAKQDPTLQIYAIDVHMTISGLMTAMNATFTVPGLPPQDDGQVVYFWPGFKSTQPTMGLPVLQPVLQYGTDSEGGGNYWCVRSWFVYGNAGIAYVSAEVGVDVDDVIASYMQYDSTKQMWTIFGADTNSGKTTTLSISRSKVQNTDFHVAMLVLETITTPGQCQELAGSPNTVTWTDISVNGASAPWIKRTQSTDCKQAVTVDDAGVVVFSWTN
jgi:hypothetical protein